MKRRNRGGSRIETDSTQRLIVLTGLYAGFFYFAGSIPTRLFMLTDKRLVGIDIAEAKRGFCTFFRSKVMSYLRTYVPIFDLRLSQTCPCRAFFPC